MFHNLLLISITNYTKTSSFFKWKPKIKISTGLKKTIKFYEKKFRIIKKDIYLKDIKQFEEIILVGSGKGVVSVNFIEGYNWKRKSKETFNKIFKTFKNRI